MSKKRKRSGCLKFVLLGLAAVVMLGVGAYMLGVFNQEDPVDLTQYEDVFVDIQEDDYYYESVLWACATGVTRGVDETHFGPDEVCTRAQVVTFLWRAVGQPEPVGTENPYEDVEERKYYYKAVLWATEQGITSGVAEGKFGPDQDCTRGQVLTLLYRACNSPDYDSTAGFQDVPNYRYYYDAINWAYERGITSGATEEQFAPKQPCTRGQVVTFLYRERMS